MKQSFLSLLVCLCATTAFSESAPASPAIVLYDNSNITTGIGNGFMGANTSTIAPGSGALGYSEDSVPFRTVQLGDQFILGSNSTISSIAFTGYSNSNYPFPPTSPFTSATLSIWNAQPGTGGAAVLFTSTTLSMTAWTGVYRVTSTAPTNAQRPVMSLSMAFPNVSLGAGTYWATWGITGIGAPGSTDSALDPPVMNPDGTLPPGNGIQSGDGGATWAPLIDGGHASVPITVNGTIVPEPSSMVLMMFGGLGSLVMLRRRG
jgi:hypothetical protein